VRGIEPAAVELLRQHRWPGNVRELRNAIERAILLTDGERVSTLDLPTEIRKPKGRPENDSGGISLPRAGLVLEDLERELVVQALTRARGNRTRAARLLGLNRDQIRYRIEKFKLSDLLPDGE
jgi:DNA-binding NtrC family response regulator